MENGQNRPCKPARHIRPIIPFPLLNVLQPLTTELANSIYNLVDGKVQFFCHQTSTLFIKASSQDVKGDVGDAKREEIGRHAKQADKSTTK